MEKRIIFSVEVKKYLKELVDLLYSQNYFGFKKDAKLYVQEIVLYINNYDFETNIRKTPKSIQNFGKKFFKFKANNRTTWYIFFDQKDNKFLVKYILNNHSKDVPELM